MPKLPMPNSFMEGLAAWTAAARQRTFTRLEAGLGTLSLVVGPGGSGKTSMLDTFTLHWHIAASLVKQGLPNFEANVRYYMHTQAPMRKLRDLDHSVRNEFIASRIPVRREDNPERFASVAREGVDQILIDHAHGFDGRLIEVCEALATRFSLDIVTAGRSLNDFDQPFDTMAGLLCFADEVAVRPGICAHCGGVATRMVTLAQSGGASEPKALPVCRLCKAGRQVRFNAGLDGTWFRVPPSSPYLCAIVGPAYAGKTEEFIREVRQYIAAGRKKQIQVFYPTEIARRNPRRIYAYNDQFVRPQTVDSIDDVLNAVQDKTTVVFIDSLEAFRGMDEEAASQLDRLVGSGKTVVCTAIEVMPSGEWHRGVGYLLCYADRITKLAATCMSCARVHKAIRTREVPPGSKPSRYLVAAPGKEYRPVCRRCLTLGTLERTSDWLEDMPATANAVSTQEKPLPHLLIKASSEVSLRPDPL